MLEQQGLARKDWDRALTVTSDFHAPIETVLVQLGLVDETRLVEVLPSAFSIPFLKASRILPLNDTDVSISVGMVSLGDLEAREAIRLAARNPYPYRGSRLLF